MKDFNGRVAVVTGAASGIGKALATRFAAEGMRVVMADVEEEALAKAAAEVGGTGSDVLSVVTDVSRRESVDALAAQAIERFGAPNVLCNNAGVAGGGGRLWETTDADWKWVLGVNLMGVVHGISAFVPAMLESGAEGHIVNTSSVLGLSTGPGAPYGVSKHGVTRLSEGLWYDLKAAGAPIGVSVLCPGLTATNIISSGRNRPDELRNEVDSATAEAVTKRQARMQTYFLEQGMDPAETASIVLDAIRDERFYVLPHPDVLKQVEARMNAILDGTAPPAPRERPSGWSQETT